MISFELYQWLMMFQNKGQDSLSSLSVMMLLFSIHMNTTSINELKQLLVMPILHFISLQCWFLKNGR